MSWLEELALALAETTHEDWADALALVFFVGLLYGLLQFVHTPT